ncbi:hypothetical protein F4818DRAFT_445638 [Hypoxylon cercidicola]|nr:hypothetical protein F4818DRAFT_445638 [Hypoxylon cercidicola]
MAAYVVPHMRAMSGTPDPTDIEKQANATNPTSLENGFSRLPRRAQDDPVNPITIVGIVCGCVIGLMIIATCIMCCCRSRGSKKTSGNMKYWADDPTRSHRRRRARRARRARARDVELQR